MLLTAERQPVHTKKGKLLNGLQPSRDALSKAGKPPGW